MSTEKVIRNTCSRECFGIKNYDGSCCSVESRDYIIGPISREEQRRFLHDINDTYDETKTLDDVFIEYEEGSNLFPEKSNWQSPQNFPALRVTDSEKKSCTFYNELNKKCDVHAIRPSVCANYCCDHLTGILDKLKLDILNLSEYALKRNGTLIPLIIDSKNTGGTGLCNPSVINIDDDIIVNVRHVGYTLHHAMGAKFYKDEGGKFQSRWGPLSYLHPEDDIKLRTNNYLGNIQNGDLININLVDTSFCDSEPL